jgi:kinesin family protein C2/C3
VDSEEDPRVGEYLHLTRGRFSTYLFENTRNTRLYFDEELGNWARMPLDWEVNVGEVRVLLEEVQRALPAWKNVREQLLVLRECNYDAQEAIAFAEVDFNMSGDTKSSKGMSLAEAKRIRELEQQVAEVQAKLSSLEEEREQQESLNRTEFTRQKTMVETKAKSKERAAADAQERAGSLAQQNAALRERNAQLESQLVAYQADADQVKILEDELAILREADTTNGVRAYAIAVVARVRRLEHCQCQIKRRDQENKKHSIAFVLAPCPEVFAPVHIMQLFHSPFDPLPHTSSSWTLSCSRTVQQGRQHQRLKKADAAAGEPADRKHKPQT